MVLVGFAAADEVLSKRLAAGFGDKARAFHLASTSIITLFGAFVFAAIAYLRRPEVHKRLMLLATITVIAPAIARVFFAVNVGIAAGLRPGLGPPRTVEFCDREFCPGSGQTCRSSFAKMLGVGVDAIAATRAAFSTSATAIQSQAHERPVRPA
jgi:hypothetical protein